MFASISRVTNELNRTTTSKESIAPPSSRSRMDGPLPTRSTRPSPAGEPGPPDASPRRVTHAVQKSAKRGSATKQFDYRVPNWDIDRLMLNDLQIITIYQLEEVQCSFLWPIYYQNKNINKMQISN